MTDQGSTIESRLFPVLRKKQMEMAFVPPQRIGLLTPLYHRIVPFVKVAPWRVIVVWAFLITIALRFLLGSSFVSLASILQKAF